MGSEAITIKTREALEDVIERAFDEDIETGDVTTDSIIDKKIETKAVWTAKDEGIVAGLGAAELVFKKLDPELRWQSLTEDGASVERGTDIATVSGHTRAILTAERTALNITQRMSGIATKTKQFVQEVEPYDTQILDTRKTIPGLRLLDKYAVRMGGGQNHRMGLYDLALIKDNHISAAGSIGNAVDKVRASRSDITIEVETTTMQQVEEALLAQADIIMLDNMSLEMMAEAVRAIGDSARTEASGNVDISTVRDIAATGVDYISVGALTHSVEAFDISQNLI